MMIEFKSNLWKKSLATKFEIRRKNDDELLRSQHRSLDLSRRLTIIENEIKLIVERFTPIDLTEINRKLDGVLVLCEKRIKRTKTTAASVEQRLIDLRTKLIIGHGYLRARHNWKDFRQIERPKETKTQRKSTIDRQWRKGILNYYRKIQEERDRTELLKDHQSVEETLQPIEPLPMIYDEIFLPEQREVFPEDISEKTIVPFQTPPVNIVQRNDPLSPSDRFQLMPDDTIIKPHRLANKTLMNMTQMSFHIDPELCSSPKGEGKKKKACKFVQFIPPAPVAPQFSSTAIFDSHAFFTQASHKMKKQRKKIDISRQPIVTSTMIENEKKSSRRKKLSPYDFLGNESINTSSKKGSFFQIQPGKIVSDDMITARFAKNSHFSSHQTSMASTKSSRSHLRLTEKQDKRKKKQINILGIGQSSPLTLSKGLNLSPGRLTAEDDDDDQDFKIQSTSKRKTRRTRAK